MSSPRTETTTQIYDTLRIQGYEEDCIVIHAHPPCSTIYESQFKHYSDEESNAIKARLGIKPSSHKINMVSLPQGCDLVLAPSINIDLNKLPGNGLACYILTEDKQIYYLDKKFKTREQLVLSEENYIKLVAATHYFKFNTEKQLRVCEELNQKQLGVIFAATNHVHNLGFLKFNTLDSPMIPLEAMNSTAYRLGGSSHFSVCFAVCNSNREFTGVYSKLLCNFTPNADDPLTPKDLEIPSLNNMMKKRNENEIKNIGTILNAVNTLSPLLTRDIDPNNSYTYQAFEYARYGVNYLCGGAGNAVHAKPKLDEFINKEPCSIRFGELSTLRELLLARKRNINKPTDDGYFTYFKSKVQAEHKHGKELEIIDKTIELLEIILLNDTAFYIKQLREIKKELDHQWIDIKTEKTNLNSQHSVFKIENELLGEITVKLTDIENYQRQINLSICLFQRFANMDPDGHANNFSKNGQNIDGDLAVDKVTGIHKNPGKKPPINDFMFYVIDFLRFPFLQKAQVRYWPATCTLIDKSTNTACSMTSATSKLTQNYFSESDAKIFQSLEHETIFSFQKYVSLMAKALCTREMYTAIAEIHMHEDVCDRNEDGEPIPLKNESGERQDVQQKWINCMSDRSQEVKDFTLELLPLKRMLEYHGDLILEMVLEIFSTFKNDSKMEMNKDSYDKIASAIDTAAITHNFEALKQRILATELGNSHVIFESTLIPRKVGGV